MEGGVYLGTSSTEIAPNPTIKHLLPDKVLPHGRPKILFCSEKFIAV